MKVINQTRLNDYLACTGISSWLFTDRLDYYIKTNNFKEGDIFTYINKYYDRNGDTIEGLVDVEIVKLAKEPVVKINF